MVTTETCDKRTQISLCKQFWIRNIKIKIKLIYKYVKEMQKECRGNFWSDDQEKLRKEIMRIKNSVLD